MTICSETENGKSLYIIGTCTNFRAKHLGNDQTANLCLLLAYDKLILSSCASN